MNYRERMKEYLKEPDEHSYQYGKWAILNKEQRDMIKRLLREMDSADEVIKQQYFEIERLNNNWNELEQWIEKERDKWEKYNPDCFVYYQSILDRMEELKGVDKE